MTKNRTFWIILVFQQNANFWQTSHGANIMLKLDLSLKIVDYFRQ